MSDEYITPRALDVVLSVSVVEALRDAAIEKIRAEIPNLRQGDDHRRADILTAAINTLRMLDVEAVLADLRTRPALEETEAFEAAAKLASFNVVRLDDGSYLHPITKRAHAIWKAAVRWSQLHQLNQNAPARRADDHQEGEKQ